MKKFDIFQISLASIGAINWGFVAFLRINLVELLCKYIPVPYLNMAIYALVALSGIYCLISLFLKCEMSN